MYQTPIDPDRQDNPIPLEMVETETDLYWHIVHSMYFEIADNNRDGRPTVFIAPVGPVFQYRRFVQLCLRRPIDLSRVYFFFMDEYMTDEHTLIPADDPLSFRGFIRQELVEAMPASMKLRPEQAIFPDPADPGAYDRQIEELGGVGTCIAGVGINGHLAFNEPPEESENVSDEEFLMRPTRVLQISRETRTINSNTALRGAIDRVPPFAITVGIKQIMAARALRIYLTRPWQSAVLRRILYGEIGATFPATFARTHPDPQIVLTKLVSEQPRFALK